MLTQVQARRELQAAGVRPCDAARALTKLTCLRAFYKADQAAGGRKRGETRRRVAETLGIPVGALEKWGLRFERQGVVGLAGVQGRRRRAMPSLTRDDLSGLALPKLVNYSRRVLALLASRLATTDRGSPRSL